MKNIFLVMLMLLALNVSSQSNAIELQDQLVEVSCGQCNFSMKGVGCTLALKIENVSYFFKNIDIDDHGDAHATDGFCNKVRKANVSGNVINSEFVATKFELLLDEPTKGDKD